MVVNPDTSSGVYPNGGDSGGDECAGSQPHHDTTTPNPNSPHSGRDDTATATDETKSFAAERQDVQTVQSRNARAAGQHSPGRSLGPCSSPLGGADLRQSSPVGEQRLHGKQDSGLLSKAVGTTLPSVTSTLGTEVFAEPPVMGTPLHGPIARLAHWARLSPVSRIPLSSYRQCR